MTGKKNPLLTHLVQLQADLQLFAMYTNLSAALLKRQLSKTLLLIYRLLQNMK
jgi:hypothetical protein